MGHGFFLFFPDSNNLRSRQIFLDELKPKAPKERLPATKNRDFEASTNKKPCLIHDALVGANHSAQIAVLALRFAYISGKSAAKLRGTSECDLPQVAHIQVL